MLKELRKRFIIFNMSVISCILIILAMFVFFGSNSNLSIKKYFVVIIASLILVFIASYIISKYALSPIKRSWQKQLDFTADASHELRSPLASIKTNLEIVLDNPNETVESQMKWLQNIELEHTRITKLVDDLLTLSRADTGEENLFTTTFVISDVIQRTVDIFQPTCQQKNIKLISKIDNSISFHGDEKRISQLIVILLDNAVKYTKPAGSIFVEVHRKENGVELIVQDTGSGIPKEDIPKIFNRFYRADNTRRQNPSGSGLGLAIAKWIVEQHNGHITFNSTLGEGTICSVILHKIK